MSKLKSAISLVIILFFFSGCQTVKDKTDAIVEKENEKLSKFLGKSASELQMELGKPDEDFKNAKGKGLSSYLIDKAKLSEIIQKTDMESLDLITAGPIPPNPAELLDSEKMRGLIKDLNKNHLQLKLNFH